MRVVQALKKLRDDLKKAGITEYKAEAVYALSAILGMSISELYLRGQEEMSDMDLSYLTERRSKGEPLAYILGERWFMGMRFYVDERVLIPRQETELLVEMALEHAGRGRRILDVCTGSGCVAISLAKLAGADVTACDISSDALDVAEKNAKELSADVRFVKSDLMTEADGFFDVITANPPYVSEAEYEELDAGVRDYEPKLALVADKNGLALYKRLAEQLPAKLAPGGFFCSEIGASQGDAVKEIFSSCLRNVKIHKDYAGLDRIVSGWSMN